VRIVIYQDFLRVGGTESQSLYLCRRFQEKGHVVTLLTNRPGGSLEELVEKNGLSHKVLQQQDRGLNWYCPGLRKTLVSLNPDIVLLMGRNANCQGYRIQKWNPAVQVIATFRTGRFVPWMYRRTLKSAPLVICNSEYARNRLRDIGIRNPAVEVHPNACLQANKIKETQKVWWSDLGLSFDLPQDHRCLLYVAAFVRGKNHDGLIRMMKRIADKTPKVTLLLVGEGPRKSRIETRVKSEGLGDYIQFAGYRSDVEKFYRIADLAVSSSVEESMPNFIVEAQYAGLPVVAFDEAGVKECFLPGESGFLIQKGDESAFISAVLGLLADESRLEKMADCSRSFAIRKFDPDVRFEAFHESVLRLASAH
jgi:glycosyltransferase involved in cell wall biosynthesis